MTISAWPFDAVGGAPVYSGRVLRQTTNAPVLAGATAARPLGAMSGVRPGTSSTSVTVTSTTWTCAPIAGVIDGEAAAEAGPYTFASDANVSGSVTAANASNPRTDIVYVQVSDPAESDGSAAPAVTIGYLAGTAGPSAPVPSAPARSFVLARINVPKSGGGSPSVTWVAPNAVAAGGIVPVRSVAELNALPGYAAMYADLVANIDNTSFPLGLYRHNGTGWAVASAYTDTGWTSLPSPSGGYNTNSIQAAEFRVSGTVVKRNELHGQLNRNTGNNVGVGDRLATFVAGQLPKQIAYFNCASNPGVTVMVSINPSGGDLTVTRVIGGTASYIILDGIYWIADQ